MKKKILAMALAFCMLMVVAPSSFAAFLGYNGDGAVIASASARTLTSTYLLVSGDVLDEGGTGNDVQSLATAELTSNTATADAAAHNTSVTVADGKVTLTKNVSANDDGTYTITLGASTQSSMITVKSACNIVLVLDASQSMVNENDDVGKLKSAVENFLNSITDSPGSKVAIISYSDAATAHTSNSDGTAFVPVVGDSGTLNSALTEATTAVETATNAAVSAGNVAKRADLGLEKAVDVIHAYNDVYPSDTTPVIVVLFTNGVPTLNVNADDIWNKNYDAYGIAQDALHWSTILKGTKGASVLTDAHKTQEFYTPETSTSNDHWSRTDEATWARMTSESKNKGCGATVYTVGINLPSEYEYETVTGGRPPQQQKEHKYGCSCCKINEFMYRASSCVPDSSHEATNYKGGFYDNSTRDQGYYLVGEMTTDLFQNIQVEGGVSLANVTLKDVLPEYLEVVNTNGGASSVDEDGKTVVTWSGSVTPGAAGALSQSFIVKFKDGFLGGHSVPTNDASSGLYAGDTLIGNFGVPTVNVEVPAITVTAVDKNVYLGQSLTANALMYGVTATIDGTSYTIDPSQANFGLESWQTAYIKSISFATTAESDLSADTTFTVSCTVTPNVAETNVVMPKTASDEANITVFKPQITFNDSTIYLSNTADYSDNHTTNCVVWLDGSGNNAAESIMTGNRPSVAVKYSLEAAAFTECTGVYVTEVLLNGSGNYRAYTTFLNNDSATTTNQFTVHVLKPTLAATDTTIYYGKSTNLDNLVSVSEWSDSTTGHSSIPAAVGSQPVLNGQCTFGLEDGVNKNTYSPSNCTDLVAIWTLAGQSFTSNSFTVHVVKPVITSADIMVYLSNTVDLNGQMTEGENWVCSHTGSGQESLPAASGSTRLAPVIDYTFTVDDAAVASESAYLPLDCATVTVTAAVGQNKTVPISDEYSTFGIHVLKPTFTVECTDLWADYESVVDLDGYGHVTLTGTSWSDLTPTHTASEADAHAGAVKPEITVGDLEFTFDSGTDGTYTLNQTTDKTVNVLSASWQHGSSSSETFTQTFAAQQPSFVIHVNKFALTISKTWETGFDVYKQDAIFTVTRKDTGETLQVVIPKSVNSVTIDGLLCGKEYTVSEDSSWTWRWTSDATKTVIHSHNGVSTTAPTQNHPECVTFTNTLNPNKKLWLDGDAWCENSFGSKQNILSLLGLG